MGQNMRACQRLIVEAIYASWAAKDLSAVLACCSDDILYRTYLSKEIAPFAGESRGMAEFIPRLKMIIDTFDFLRHSLLFAREEGEVIHGQIRYHYRHKQTGHAIEGTLRHIWRLERDLVTQIDEFHDRPRVHAFFGLLAEAESGKPQRSFPDIRRGR
jgi:ketosteroid isomerase-like protein